MGVRWRQAEVETAHGRALSDSIRGKSVVLVGPAASLMGSGRGGFIDSHDVVVRLNLAVPIPPEREADIGTRTDILYHVLYSANHLRHLGRQHTAAEVQAWHDSGVKFVITRHAPGDDRVRRIKPVIGKMPLIFINQRWKEGIKRETRTNPNTGTLAIAHLMTLPIRSLFVTGFDFYQTGYYPGYGGLSADEAARGGGNGEGYAAWGQISHNRIVHHQDGQKEYLHRLATEDSRLQFDEVAKGLLGIAPRGPSVTALVPMKGSSERVHGKNVRDLAGKPLLYWTLSALRQAQRVERIVVDTDSDDIESMVSDLFPDITVLRRPKYLQDAARVSGNDLIKWELSKLEGEHFGQFHVTSPLITPLTIDRAIDAYFSSDEHDSLMTVTEHHFWLFKADGTAVNSDTRRLVRSQDLEPLYEDNNAAHIFSRASFEATGSRIGERVQMHPIPKVEAIDIDYEDDFVIADAVMRHRNRGRTEEKKPRNPYEKRRAA